MFKLWYNWIISTIPLSPSKPCNVAPSFLTDSWTLLSMGSFGCRFLRAYLLASQRLSMFLLIFPLFNFHMNYIIIRELTPSFYILSMIQSVVLRICKHCGRIHPCFIVPTNTFLLTDECDCPMWNNLLCLHLRLLYRLFCSSIGTQSH